jgi:tRNA dimethylallyltransferase
MKRVVVICGATATGKTKLALNLAAHWKRDIINFDSVQVYRGFDIGSAKPSQAEQKLVPHFLIDIANPDINYSAGDFCRDASAVLTARMNLSDPLALLVGGTGFYLKALTSGMDQAPPSDPEVKKKWESRLKERGSEELHKELAKRDETSASKIHPHDSYRVLRALEIIDITGLKLSRIKQVKGPKLDLKYFKVGLRRKREILFRAILQRAERMVGDGLIEETKELAKVWGKEARPLKSVGYLQAMKYLNGEIKTKENLIAEIALRTRQLAKRQNTWFKADKEIYWIDPDEFQSSEALKEKVLALWSLDKNA